MKNSFKKIVSILLSLVIIMSVMALGFSAFAENDADVAPEETTIAEVDEEEGHTTFIALTIQFFKDIFNFFKYIFYDVFLGRPVPDVPPLSHTHSSTVAA